MHLKCKNGELIKFCKYPDPHYHKSIMVIKNKPRPIATPIGRFRIIIERLKCLLNRIEMPDYIHGGVKKRSIKTNAAYHIGKPVVLNFDIKDFFPSISPKIVSRLFRKRLGCSPSVCEILVGLVTLHGELPQGSPTSTVVANLIILPLANRLKILSNKHGSDYGQFVDDGTFSGPSYVGKLRKLIEKIIRQEGFEASPKPHKRKTMYSNEEQIVTGVRVNKRLDMPKQKIDEIKKQLAHLEQQTVDSLSPKDRFT
jgi:RNA-directed DNA polymerase